MQAFLSVLAVFWALNFTGPATGSQEVLVFDFDGLEEYLGSFGPEKVLVVNFWATWCVPCVKELPYFEEANAKYEGSDVEVILVSLDFETHLESRVKPFLESKEIKSTVVLLDAPDANAWIDKVSPEWSGAIPATLITQGDKRAFYEQSFHSFEEIQQIIQPFLKS